MLASIVRNDQDFRYSLHNSIGRRMIIAVNSNVNIFEPHRLTPS